MQSQSFVVIDLPKTASSSVENATDNSTREPMRPNSEELEAFTVRVAWLFASAVLLLLAVSLLLAVVGYVGSTFASDLQPKSVSSYAGR
ncbi:MAG TPA: hypothetical protein VNO32_61945 [Candidatus Acidoferrum sp.]|nr:hypothetical protein [Candidatus Acidoferrum sp.]